MSIKTQSEYNYGISLLKILMSFEVVCCHFWKNGFSLFLKPFELLRDYAVPSFMLVSFYLFVKKCDIHNNSKIRSRLNRIICPHIIWSFLVWGIYYLYGFFSKKNIVKLSDLGWQILTGHSYNAPMWFMVDLFILTLIFIAIMKMIKNKSVLKIILVSLVVTSFYLEYSELFFSIINELRFEIKYPLGRLIEMIPYASTGMLCALTRAEKVLKKRVSALAFPVLYLVLFFCFKKKTDILSCNGFNYQGLGLFILSCLFSLSFIVIVQNINSAVFKKFVFFIGRYTFGVFCMHNIIGKIIGDSLSYFGIAKDTFFESLIIYIVCIVVCIVLDKNRFTRFLVH